MTRITTLVIKADGTQRIDVDVEVSLDYFQGIVGGWIEATGGTTAGGVDWYVYLNEDGKDLPDGENALPVNKVATDLARDLNWQGMRGDVFNGDVVFLGPPDEEGEDTDVPQAVLDAAKGRALFTVTEEFIEDLERRDIGRQRDYRGDYNRSLSTEWVLGPSADGGTLVARLTTSHWKDSKQFAATLQKIELRPAEGPFTIERFGLFNGVQVFKEPVARFSDKGLQAAHDKALRLLLVAVREGLLTSKATDQFDKTKGA